MSDKNKSIHEFDFEVICEYFSYLERQGPGSPEVTIKALSFIDNLNNNSLIADIGCGSGGQTMVLAQHAPGKITGIDMFPVFWKILLKIVQILNRYLLEKCTCKKQVIFRLQPLLCPKLVGQTIIMFSNSKCKNLF